MDVTKARQIVSSTISGRLRWGKLFASEYNMEEVLDALCTLETEVGLLQSAEGEDITELKAKLATANRQLGAAKAREAKLKMQLDAAKSGS